MRYACVVVMATALGVGCSEPDGLSQTPADFEKCQQAIEEPYEAIGACTLLMSRARQQLMDATRARVHRGDAFAEMEEYEHAKVDYRWVLAQAPAHKSAKWAKEKLAEIEEGEKLSAEPPR